MSVNNHIRLYVSPQRFVLEPLSNSESEPSLVIDRVTHQISKLQSQRQSFNPDDKVQDIYGVMGIIRLLSGPFLIVITGRRHVGKLFRHDIWRVTKARIISFSTDSSDLTASQKSDESIYLSMLEYVLGMDGFYFSYDYDVTHCFQRVRETDMTAPLWLRADTRFFWNHFLVKDFIAHKLDSWILPITFGYLEIQSNISINGKKFDYTLISRRHLRRPGTRYHVRGIDKEGNVANFVETEQLLISENGIASFVQTRGSIPVFWNQSPSIKYKPSLFIGEERETTAAFRRHFEDLTKTYGLVTCVNLIDQKGSELKLGTCYENQVRVFDNPKVKYIAFDFHHQCRNMKYDNLSILIDQISSDLEKNGYLSADKTGAIVGQQKGIFRVNCIDNLDRTNVVQSLLARRALSLQLTQFGITNVTSDVFEKQFEQIFKNVWGNNADAISRQYSGTGALKTDYTRTGKRNIKGVLNDGINSVIRYYLNNFVDGFRQDAFDLFVGNYKVDVNSPSPFSKSNHFHLYYLLVVIFIILAVILLSSYFLPTELTLFHRFLMALVWAVVFFLVWKLTLTFGKSLVNKPLLYVVN